jgi:hypothetical protein
MRGEGPAKWLLVSHPGSLVPSPRTIIPDGRWEVGSLQSSSRFHSTLRRAPHLDSGVQGGKR